MIQSVLSYTLVGLNLEFDPTLDIYQTVFVQGRNAVATIALASYSQGADLGARRAGWAGAFITKAGVVVGPNRTDTLPLDPRDVNRTQLRIEKCSFVTFRMVLSKAEARATATVFVEDGPVSAGAIGPKLKTLSAYLYDASSGKISGIHHVAFPAGQRLPTQAAILRRIRNCAAEAQSVSPRSIGVALVRKSDPGLTSALTINPRTGRARVAPATVAGSAVLSPGAVRSAL